MKKKWLLIPFSIVVTAIILVFTYDLFVTIEIKKEEALIPPVLEYGIPVDSFNIEKVPITRNQTLGTILNARNLSNAQIFELETKAAGVIDMRKIRAGNVLKFFTSSDSLQRLAYMVYEVSPVEYVVFSFGDSITVVKNQKDVVSIRRKASGTIQTSLWEAMVKDSLPPSLVLDLSDIYAWTIDFFAIQKGDGFEVIYDELYIDKKSVGVGKIYGARFTHRGEPYLAVSFDQDSIQEYWDEIGNNLRKAFLKAPLKFSRISSRFSRSRFHPVLRIYRPHTGVDYAAPTGTPVMSIGDGTVIGRAYSGGGGNGVKIRHNASYSTGYLHLSAYGKGIHVGARVKQGQIIGYVGQTGYATGPHLDFRVWKNGTAVNPLLVKAPPVEPMKKENMAAYMVYRDSIQAVLNGRIEMRDTTVYSGSSAVSVMQKK
ncbi:M23 family metallopeptidase [Williamwhitmania taraxaci]|uniref:Murein DD-endopeptidase MepM and murein hydrolase activator NlpD, contain LysM domain n=1 Tax=Williamwhitmania taraxaci TaxID=1640674 RepID=A0A1G6KIZ5_9BACT|nr:M23 family metallopeptidase [Williamwhitmania taraxaci]SDC31082.1 Murein DD-endopeptidase MepM and murein hydrolase activator NlpD, contain LysM domain [Williamwhitmania taraxaci]